MNAVYNRSVGTRASGLAAACRVGLLGFSLLTVVGTTLVAESVRSIRVVGREKVTVTTSTIRLGDVAEVSSPLVTDDEAVIGLQRILLSEGITPGEKRTLAASDVLQKLVAEGVNLDQVRYMLPRAIAVSRAGRAIERSEIKAAIERYLLGEGRNAALKDITYPSQSYVVPGIASIEARPLATTGSGARMFSIDALVPGEQPVQFSVPATIDEWIEVPVATRPLGKGSIIEGSDVMMARMNTNALPADIIRDTKDVLGLAALREIEPGEVMRKQKLQLPAIVAAGAPVVAVFRSGSLEVTARATALDAGAMGQELRVRNDTSKKVIVGTVIAPGLVEVRSLGAQ